MPLENSSVRNLPFSLNNQSWPKLECNAASTALTLLPLQAAPESLRRLHRVRAAGRWRSAALQPRGTRAQGLPGETRGKHVLQAGKATERSPLLFSPVGAEGQGHTVKTERSSAEKAGCCFHGRPRCLVSLRGEELAESRHWSGVCDMVSFEMCFIERIRRRWCSSCASYWFYNKILDFFFLKLKCCPTWFLR